DFHFLVCRSPMLDLTTSNRTRGIAVYPNASPSEYRMLLGQGAGQSEVCLELVQDTSGIGDEIFCTDNERRFAKIMEPLADIDEPSEPMHIMVCRLLCGAWNDATGRPTLAHPLFVHRHHARHRCCG